MAKDTSEKKSKKERRQSDVATLAVADVLVEKQTDHDGDTVMEAEAVAVVVKVQLNRCCYISVRASLMPGCRTRRKKIKRLNSSCPQSK